MSATDAPLEDGWQPTTPPDDSVTRSYVLAFAGMLSDLGRVTGARRYEDEGVVALDTGSEFFLANGAVLRQPLAPSALRAALARAGEFFRGTTGGPWIVLSAWPTPDLRDDGFSLVGHPPFMLRPVGGEAPPDPPGLQIVEARDPRTLRDFADALEAGYPAPDAAVLAHPALATVDDLHLWVGYLDDRPVATAAAHRAPACTHVEYVSTLAEVRGRGVGAALTWRAALVDPTLPSVLLASDAGQPVYERMGYLRIVRMTLWMGQRAP